MRVIGASNTDLGKLFGLSNSVLSVSARRLDATPARGEVFPPHPGRLATPALLISAGPASRAGPEAAKQETAHDVANRCAQRCSRLWPALLCPGLRWAALRI